MGNFATVVKLGNIETPIVLTNTLLPTAADALISYTLQKKQKRAFRKSVVGETNDGYLNDIRERRCEESVPMPEKCHHRSSCKRTLGQVQVPLLRIKGGIGPSRKIQKH